MQKNIVINKTFEKEEYTHEMQEEFPLLFCKNTGVKIMMMRVVFKEPLYYYVAADKADETYYIQIENKYFNLDTGAESTVKINENKKYDVYNNKFVDFKTKPKPKICYLSTDDANNSVILNNPDFGGSGNVYFNMIAANFLKNNQCYLETDWLSKRNKLKLYFYDENFDKLFIHEIFINIKINFANETPIIES